MKADSETSLMSPSVGLLMPGAGEALRETAPEAPNVAARASEGDLSGATAPTGDCER